MTAHDLNDDQRNALRNLLHAAMTHGASIDERGHELTLRIMREREEDFLWLLPTPEEPAKRTLAGALNLSLNG